MKILLYLTILLLLCCRTTAQQDANNKQQFKIKSAPIFEISLSSQISTFHHLDESLKNHTMERQSLATYLAAGIGYGSHYKNLSLATIGRYGTNVFKFNQYFLDWNIIRLFWAFKIKDHIRLSPIVGLGILYLPVSLKMEENKQSSLSGLTADPNYLTLQNSWTYLNFGVSLSSYKIDRTNITIGIIYSRSLKNDFWKNGAVTITDIPSSAMNRISLSLSFSRY